MKSNTKGGPRRHKIEDVCSEHLHDMLLKWIQNNGENQAFEMGDYANLTKSQGMCISAGRFAGTIV